MYSDKFRRIKQDTLQSCKRIGEVIWNNNFPTETKVAAIKVFLIELSDIYDMPTPNFTYEPELTSMYDITGGGRLLGHTIYLYKKLSYVTLLHEFRHYMQFVKGDSLKMIGDREDDARAWSMSIFKQTFPDKWQRAVDRGIVHFV